eukprot:jgi/Astpho2/9023/fgenesh1_pg.00133_%23_54_t
MQINVGADQAFSLELSVVAVDGSRRKMLMSTAFHEAKPTPLHCQLPLAGVQQGTWQNLLLDMAGLTRACFKGSMFQAVDLICLSSAFKVRRIFTLRDAPAGVPAGEGHPVQLQAPKPAAESAALACVQHQPQDGSSSEASPKMLTSTSRQYDGPMHLAFGTRFPAPASPGQASPAGKRRRPSTTQAVPGHEWLGAEGLAFQTGQGDGGQPTSRRAVSAAVPVRPGSMGSPSMKRPTGHAMQASSSLAVSETEACKLQGTTSLVAAGGTLPQLHSPTSPVSASSGCCGGSFTGLTGVAGLQQRLPIISAHSGGPGPEANLSTVAGSSSDDVEGQAADTGRRAGSKLGCRRQMPARRVSWHDEEQGKQLPSLAQRPAGLGRLAEGLVAVTGTSLEGPSLADSVQLWDSKAANRRYSELGEGMLDRQGGAVVSTAVAGIENRVAPEDLPLSRLPSRAARCLAGRRPLEPVAEVPQGQGSSQLNCKLLNRGQQESSCALKSPRHPSAALQESSRSSSTSPEQSLGGSSGLHLPGEAAASAQQAAAHLQQSLLSSANMLRRSRSSAAAVGRLRAAKGRPLKRSLTALPGLEAPAVGLPASIAADGTWVRAESSDELQLGVVLGVSALARHDIREARHQRAGPLPPVMLAPGAGRPDQPVPAALATGQAQAAPAKPALTTPAAAEWSDADGAPVGGSKDVRAASPAASPGLQALQRAASIHTVQASAELQPQHSPSRPSVSRRLSKCRGGLHPAAALQLPGHAGLALRPLTEADGPLGQVMPPKSAVNPSALPATPKNQGQGAQAATSSRHNTFAARAELLSQLIAQVGVPKSRAQFPGNPMLPHLAQLHEGEAQAAAGKQGLPPREGSSAEAAAPAQQADQVPDPESAWLAGALNSLSPAANPLATPGSQGHASPPNDTRDSVGSRPSQGAQGGRHISPISQCAGSGGSPLSETDDDVVLACVPSTNTSRCTTPGPPILDFTPPHTAAYPKGKGGLPYDPSRYQASPDATRAAFQLSSSKSPAHHRQNLLKVSHKKDAGFHLAK